MRNMFFFSFFFRELSSGEYLLITTESNIYIEGLQIYKITSDRTYGIKNLFLYNVVTPEPNHVVLELCITYALEFTRDCVGKGQI